MIYRSPSKTPYTSIPNKILTDKNLSFKARGLLCYMLSLPDNWEFNIDHLVTLSEKDGKTAIQSAFQELAAKGFARLEQRRSANGARAMGKRWAISEDGFSDNEVFCQSENLTVRNSDSQKTGSYSNYSEESNYLEESKEKEIAKAISPANGSARKRKPLAEDNWIWQELQFYGEEFDTEALNDDLYWANKSNTFPTFTQQWVAMAFADLAQWLTSNPTRRPRSRAGWHRRMSISLEYFYEHKYLRREANGTKPQYVSRKPYCRD